MLVYVLVNKLLQRRVLDTKYQSFVVFQLLQELVVFLKQLEVYELIELVLAVRHGFSYLQYLFRLGESLRLPV